MSLRHKIEAELPEAGFTIADRRDPSPQVSRTLERLRQFLTLIGLTALLVGGVGIANAVATFIDKRRKVIATMKSIGATSRMVLGIFLAEVLAVAAMGVVLGLVLGTLAPLVLDALFGDMLPIHAEIDRDAAERRHGARLRVRRRAAVHAVAAGARRAHQRQHAVPRRGGAGAHAAAHLGHRRDARRRRGARRLCHADVGFKEHRHLFLRRAHRRVRRVLRARHGGDLGRAPRCRGRACRSCRWRSAISARRAA